MAKHALATRIKSWFRQHGRDLPWRHTSDPYAILISEVMLQQTQVSRVEEKWVNWLRLFPTWEALAKASTADVLTAWSGLGYNRRALALQELAKTVVSEHGGVLPQTVEGLTELRGLGPYTARAILAFAFRVPHIAPVDTNIARILKRVTGTQNLSPRELQQLADENAPEDSWTYNHAMMDFGATMCTARAPKCEICPLKDICASYPCLGDDSNKPKQKKFTGSDRQYRGKILRVLLANSCTDEELIQRVGLKNQKRRFLSLVHDLAKEQFIERMASRWSIRK